MRITAADRRTFVVQGDCRIRFGVDRRFQPSTCEEVDALDGVKRRTAGSIGDKLWALFEKESRDLDDKTAKDKVVAKSFDATSASIALCDW